MIENMKLILSPKGGDPAKKIYLYSAVSETKCLSTEGVNDNIAVHQQAITTFKTDQGLINKRCDEKKMKQC